MQSICNTGIIEIRQIEKDVFNKIHQTPANFNKQLSIFICKSNVVGNNNKIKFNIIFQNYLVHYINWIFDVYSNATPVHIFVKFIENIIVGSKERLILLHNEKSNELFEYAQSALKRTIENFECEFLLWKRYNLIVSNHKKLAEN